MLRSTGLLVFVVALGFAAPSVWAADDDADAKQKAARAGETRATLPAGVKPRDAEDANDVFSTFDGLTQAAMTKEGFDDVVERLVDQDRNRIGNYAEKKFDDLDGVVDALNKAWKQKFDDDFELQPDKAFKSLALIRGEIEDPKQVAANWPVKPVAQPAGDAVAAAAAEKAEQENQRGNNDPNLNSNIEKGRDVAIATVPASHGLPAIHVSLIREAQGWRIDVPNNIAGEKLKDNLIQHLTHVKDKAQWPSDRNDAAAMLAHHVLMAVYNVDVPKSE